MNGALFAQTFNGFRDPTRRTRGTLVLRYTRVIISTLQVPWLLAISYVST
jgi:hypothetical protein